MEEGTRGRGGGWRAGQSSGWAVNGSLLCGGDTAGRRGGVCQGPDAGEAPLVPGPGLAHGLGLAPTGESPRPPSKDHRKLTESVSAVMLPPRPWDTCPRFAPFLLHCPRAPRGDRLCHPVPSC